MDNSFFNSVSSAALSLTASGTTGISPFLTLFILGLIEKVMPDLLPMGGRLEIILASWWSLIVLGLLTVVEIVSKCVPALDEVIDSFEVFLVPILSVVATMATLGISPNSSVDGSVDSDGTVTDVDDDDDENNRFWTALRVSATVGLVLTGAVLSLLIHILKMIIRVSSLTCAAGLCQPCITLLEVIVVCVWIIFAILSPVFAIVACLILLVGAVYALRVKFCSPKTDADAPNGPTVAAATTAAGSGDVELGGAAVAPPVAEATAVLVVTPRIKTAGGLEHPTAPTANPKTDQPKLQANLYG